MPVCHLFIQEEKRESVRSWRAATKVVGTGRFEKQYDRFILLFPTLFGDQHVTFQLHSTHQTRVQGEW